MFLYIQNIDLGELGRGKLENQSEITVRLKTKLCIKVFLILFFFFTLFFYGSIVDLQCCANLLYNKVIQLYTYRHSFLTSLPL